jgi:hypothetical protein
MRCVASFSILKVSPEGLGNRFFESLVSTYKATRCQNSEDHNLNVQGLRLCMNVCV